MAKIAIRSRYALFSHSDLCAFVAPSERKTRAQPYILCAIGSTIEPRSHSGQDRLLLSKAFAWRPLLTCK